MFTVKFTEAEYNQAVDEARKLQEENYDRNTRPLSDTRDIVGVLGQYAAAQYLDINYLTVHKAYNAYVPRQRGDVGDGIVYDQVYDVKSHEVKKLQYLESPLSYCSILRHQEKHVAYKKIDFYIFVNVYLVEPRACVLGAYSAEKFWRDSRPSPQFDSHFLKAIELKSVDEIINHV
jgi:hypothetical protein